MESSGKAVATVSDGRAPNSVGMLDSYFDDSLVTCDNAPCPQGLVAALTSYLLAGRTRYHIEQYCAQSIRYDSIKRRQIHCLHVTSMLNTSTTTNNSSCTMRTSYESAFPKRIGCHLPAPRQPVNPSTITIDSVKCTCFEFVVKTIELRDKLVFVCKIGDLRNSDPHSPLATRL